MPTQSNPYAGLREMALHSSREKIGIPSDVGHVWGFLMDWGIESGTVTVVAYADGSASVYLSNGGGYIGGKGQPLVRRAAENAVKIANELTKDALSPETFPLPQKDEVCFYLLTDAGILAAHATVKEVASHQHRFSRLGDAAQEIITQYRNVQNKT